MVAMIAQAVLGGGYFSPLKIGAMLILVLPWLYMAPWVHRDSKHISAPSGVWAGGYLGAGAAAVLFWMLVPVYILGLLVYIVVVAATLGSYIVYRNGRVEEGDKIGTADFFTSRRSRAAASVEVVQQVTVYDGHGRVVRPPRDDSPPQEKIAYNAVQDFLIDVVYHRASEIDLSPSGRHGRVRLVIDGVMSELEPLDMPTSESIIQFLKAAGQMDTNERRRPQRGQISLDLAGKRTDIVMTTAGTTGGQRMQLRVVQEVVRTKLDELGIAPDVLDRVRAACKGPGGLLIVAGKARNGVTSTLYSLLRDQDAFTKQLVTLESRKVVDLENISHHEYDKAENLAGNLATLSRRDPDVIMVDSCPDAATAEVIRKIAADKLVLLGMAARDSFTALARWVQLCGDAGAATKPLKGVLCQVLLRKLCSECREHYSPDPQMIAKANLAGRNTDSFYRKPVRPQLDEKGRPIVCTTCQNSGYFGRTGAFEYIEVTDDIRSLITSTTDLRRIKSACRKNGMRNLQEAALDKVIEGVTSVKEVIRVTQEAKKKKR